MRLLQKLLLIAGCLAGAGVRAQDRAANGDALELLRQLVQDDAPRVRVEALRALAKIPTAESAAVALDVLEKPMDPTLEYALWLTINDLAEPWIGAVESGAWPVKGHERQLEFALRALRPEQASRLLSTTLGETPLPRDGSGPWIDVIGAAGGPKELRRLCDQARQGGFNAAATARALAALREAARLRNVRPTGDLAEVGIFLHDPDPAVRLEAVRLAGRWKDIGGALPVLLKNLAANRTASPEERSAVFESLRQIGGAEVTAGLQTLAAHQGDDPGLRRTAATTLAAVDMLRGIPAVLQVATTISTDADALQFWREVLGIQDAARPLRESLDGRSLPAVAARAGMRVAREGGREDIQLVAAFARAGGLTADTQGLEARLIAELAARAAASGNARRGEQVFRRGELACTTCHAIGGAGGRVGPDLTSIGASAPMDYLVESVLMPSARIKEGYNAVIVETRDGEEITGTLARETPEELFLQTAAGVEVSVAKGNMERRETGRLSIMPSGLVELLPERDRLDLFAFLGRLGKPGEFDASRGGVARFWRVANVVHTDVQNNQADWFWKTPLRDNRWTPLYSLVSGDLPGPLIEGAIKAEAWTSKVAVVLATEIEQAAAGVVHFRLAESPAEVWVEGRYLGKGPELAGNLPSGRHRVIVKLDPQHLPERIRLEAEGATFVLN